MQNNKGCLEPAGELPSYEDVLQDVLDIQDILVDHEAMQQILENDNSFSESECGADSSKDLDDVISSDDEYDGPLDVPCEECSHFLFTEFDKARAHQVQLERMMGEPDRYELTEDDKLHIRPCYLGFYADLDNVISD